MKKIEFRAWDGKTMLRNVGVHPHILTFHGVDDEDYKESSEGAFTVCQKFADYKIMQFTGSIDKKGVKIFEDDVVLWKGKKGELEFSHTCKVLFDDVEFNGYVLKSQADEERGYIPIGLYGAKTDELEVVGNIYENLKIKF